MTVAVDRQALAGEISQFASIANSAEELMSLIVARLKERLPGYDWVGFYMIERGTPDMLVLGPYIGAPTEHTRIPLNRGICGAAVTSGQTVVVDDVNSDPRYLACSLETKSEIVAPVWMKGAIVGELDIDSHTPAAFKPDDRKLVEHCAAVVGKYLEKTAA